MRYAIATAAIVGAATAQGWGGSDGWSSDSNGPWGTDYTTEVVPEWTTFCPEATQISHNGQTWSVTTPTTLVLTSFTVTKPAQQSWTSPASQTSAWTTSAVETTPTSAVETSPINTWTSAPSSSWTTMPTETVAPVPSSIWSSVPSVAPFPSANGTTTAPVISSAGTTPATWSSSASQASPTQTASYNGAAKAGSAVGAAFVALFGFAAAAAL